MRLGLNVLAIVAIVAGIVAGSVAAGWLQPGLAFAVGGGVTCATDLVYRMLSGDFETRGGFLDVRHAMGTPTRIPVWIVAFALGAGMAVVSMLKTPGERSSSSTGTASAAYASYTPSSATPTPPPAPPAEPVEPVDKRTAAKFIAFYQEWLRAASDPKRDCAALLKQMRVHAKRDGEAVRSVYASGKSLAPDQQQEFEGVVTQLKSALDRCPDIQIQEEIARVASGDRSDD